MVMLEGRIRSIYVHFDGYLEGVGQTLLDNYKDDEKISQLLDLGDLSILAGDIGKKHDFDSHDSKSGMCLAYGRDRGEKKAQAKDHADVKDFVVYRRKCDCECLYLWKNGKWLVYTPPDDYPEWKSIEQALKEI